MPPSPTFAERANARRIRHIATICFASVSLLAVAFAFEPLVLAQMPSEPSSTQSASQSSTDDGASATNSDDSGDTGELGGSLSAAGNGLTPAALSSDQIISILQNNPDVLAEFKSELADRLQQQGAQIDVDDISDQTLFNQISASAPLRANITTVLVARGFATSDDLQMSHSSTTDDATPNSLSSAQSSRMPANSGSQTGIKSSDRGGNTGALTPTS